ncbi:DNA-binding GntR family transcriptional regulator [Aquibacillus albus]|uniref:DNA-binding GntR family transcriptional regulator n=2 Tax=Aquibacillus albus TaxID=1168171 RepID=A0ABS2MXT6_9BACI|nr:DNA-binding GntR family transcriptional regulator [Aquibacillus albus]
MTHFIEIQYIGFMKTFKRLNRLPLREEIYEHLKEAIVTLQLSPGQKIKDSDFAKEFGTSRTPVREAFKKLEIEGLIESLPSSSTRVTELNAEEAQNSFTVVAALQSLAARQAIPNLKDDDIMKLKEANQALKLALDEKNIRSAVESDDEFHHVLVIGSRNKEIEQVLANITPKIRRLEFAKFGSITGLDSVQQHDEIIQAAKSGDAELTAKLVEENWLSLGRLLVGSKTI